MKQNLQYKKLFVSYQNIMNILEFKEIGIIL